MYLRVSSTMAVMLSTVVTASGYGTVESVVLSRK